MRHIAFLRVKGRCFIHLEFRDNVEVGAGDFIVNIGDIDQIVQRNGVEMKAIIYAMGQVFARYQEKIDWSRVVAIADKDPKGIKEVRGVPVITIHELIFWEYDYIAIFSNILFDEIKTELIGEHFVSPDRIVSWRDLLVEKVDSGFKTQQFYRMYIEEYGYRKILDFGMSVLPKFYFMKQEFLPEPDAVLDGVLSLSAKLNICLYDHIYETGNIFVGDTYDAVLVWDMEQLTDAFWSGIQGHAKHLLLYTPYLMDGKFHKEQTKADLQFYGAVSCLAMPEGLFWCVDLKPIKPIVNLEDITIFVVTHKEHNLCHDLLYRPLCVGDYQKEGFLTEQTGENIAYLNPKINECTALYWIWKNTSGQYVGLNHYRRYFYNNHIICRDNYLDIEYASKILREYDIILPEISHVDNMSVFDQLNIVTDRELCHKGYQILRDEIKRKQPEYLGTFDDVLSGHDAYFCNLFVTRRDIFNQYCEWLFSFLIDATNKLDVDSYDSYNQRMMGFFAERMMTVWLRRQRLKIKELPRSIIV